MLRLLPCLLAATLAACAAPPPPPAVPASLFQDARFTPPARAVDESAVFALNEPMRHYLFTELASKIRRDGALQALVDALYHDRALHLDYDSARTFTAAEAFDARRGNCLSLVIMTAALGRALGLQVSFQAVDVDVSWSHSGNLLVQSDHVNLVLSQPDIDRRPGYFSTWSYTIDFLPSREAQGLDSHVISESRVLALYLNNRAVEALAHGDVDEAYWWARASLARDPGFGGAYNTLGVIYLRHGDLAAARTALETLLAVDANNLHALNNLAIVYERQGLQSEARALRERLARVDPDPPYRYFFEGRAAMNRGDYRTARAWFDREVRRAGYCSEFHFWLGLAELHLGELDHARREITVALQNSTTSDEYALYAGKLKHLQQRAVQ